MRQVKTGSAPWGHAFARAVVGMAFVFQSPGTWALAQEQRQKIQLPDSLKHDLKSLPKELRRDSDRKGVRARALKRHSDARVIAAKARDMATAASELVPPAE